VPTAVTALPEDLEGLRALALRQQREIAESTERIDALAQQLRFYAEYVRLLKHHRFGRSSEQLRDGDDAGQAQLALAFNEAEASAREAADDAGDEADAPAGVAVAAHVRTPRGRRPLPAWIPRVEVLHDLADAEKVCAGDGAPLARIGEEVLEQLELIPASVRVLRHVRPRYACPKCHQGVHAAPLPPQPIPKSLASPALLAHVAIAKYADGLPLYRQERMLVRAGIELPRATLASWMVKAGELVQPLINLLREDLLATGFVQCDETPFQVLKETGKPATSTSYVWVQRGPPERPIVLYDYDPSRSAEVPKRLLQGFTGILQTDGYAGYDALGREPGIVHAGCWAHARRKFVEALKGHGGSDPKRQSHARHALSLIQKLYLAERRVQAAAPEGRTRLRDELSRPVITALREWLDPVLARVPPQSLTGKALAYLDGQWPRLVRVLDDGRIPLDTNAVENAIRPFVVGRKNWLFADTVRGAEASANLYSLLETAKAAGLEPLAYLQRVFAALPRATTLEDFEALLPARQPQAPTSSRTN
jgi:transposase